MRYGKSCTPINNLFASVGGLSGRCVIVVVIGGGCKVVVIVVVEVVVVAWTVVVVIVGSLGLCSLLSFSFDLIVDRVQRLSLRAVEIEPPIANKILLVENGSIGAQERFGSQNTGLISLQAHMKSLALSGGVSIITLSLTVAVKVELGGIGIDGVISSRLSRDGL